MRRDSIERVILVGVRSDLLAPARVEQMAKEMRAAYAERMREVAARVELLPREVEEFDARIGRLRERLKAGDPDLTTDELQVGIDRAEAKRRELLSARPTESENTRALAMLQRAAELYRDQIEQGLGGDPSAVNSRQGASLIKSVPPADGYPQSLHCCQIRAKGLKIRLEPWLARSLAMSERTLRRRFHESFGDAPKSLSPIESAPLSWRLRARP